MDYKNEYPERSGCFFLAVGAFIFVALCTLGGIICLFT